MKLVRNNSIKNIKVFKLSNNVEHDNIDANDVYQPQEKTCQTKQKVCWIWNADTHERCADIYTRESTIDKEWVSALWLDDTSTDRGYYCKHVV